MKLSSVKFGKTGLVLLAIALFFYLPQNSLALDLKSALKFKLPPRLIKYLTVNRPSLFLKGANIVFAGKKYPNTSIMVNGKEVISANTGTSWYYELPIKEFKKTTVIAAGYKSKGLANPVNIIFPKDYRLFSVEPPVIIGIRLDPATRDIIITIKDPVGVLSYNVYYANALNYIGGKSPFVVGQSNYPVSGTGITEWRDNGTYTGSHPMAPGNISRFYKVEVNRTDEIAPVVTITSPKDGEVIR